MKTPEINTRRKVLLVTFILLFTSILCIVWLKFLDSAGCQAFATINGIEFYVETADNPAERAKGLSNRESLGIEQGMVFLYEDEGYRNFWMKETLIPLDIIFIDENYRIVNIIENARPCPPNNCQSYHSVKEAKYVLEVNAGLSQKYGFQMGNKVEFRNIREI